MPEPASWGGLLLGGCLILGGVSDSWGCLLQGGCLLLGGVVSQHTLRQTPPPWTESQTPVKTLPWPNFVAASNYYCSIALYFIITDIEQKFDPGIFSQCGRLVEVFFVL